MGYFVIFAIFVSLCFRCESFRINTFSPRVLRTTNVVNRKSLPRLPASSKYEASKFLAIAQGASESAAEFPDTKTSLPKRVLSPLKRATFGITRKLSKRLGFRSSNNNEFFQNQTLNGLAQANNTLDMKPTQPLNLPCATNKMPNRTRSSRLWLDRNASMVSWSDWSMSPTGNLIWLTSWTWPLVRACRDLAFSGVIAGWKTMAGVCSPVWQRLVAPPLKRWYSVHCEVYLERFWKQKGEPWMDRLVRHYILPRMDKQSLVGTFLLCASEVFPNLDHIHYSDLVKEFAYKSI